MGNGEAGQSRTDRNSERGERQVWIAGGLPAGGIGDEEGIALIQAEKFESQLKSALELSRKMIAED